ncbi:hypothetical protein BJ875DRAFT_509889 [Amylocarpus encephaloides]|uniref:Uncharacterized protein n=1 Tax=Amylocarpus encephaloides TaxID=45428 RepID=A0A9P7YJJ4_9HELO|nr:hypothetical protein BJ875DRAFT_509889 [Amylocarpus encephaloides]
MPMRYRNPHEDRVGSEMVIPAGKPYLTKVNGKLVMARNKKDKPFQRGIDLLTGELLSLPVQKRSKSVPPTPRPLIISGIPYYPHPPPLRSDGLLQPQPLLVPQMIQPAPILVRVNPDAPELTQQDFDKLVKVSSHFNPVAKETHKQKPEEVKKSTEDEASAQNSIKITIHACAKCGRIRSRKYHHEHPIKSGELPPPDYCRKCQRDSSSTSGERSPVEYKKSKSKSNGKKTRRRCHRGRPRSGPVEHIMTIEAEIPRREEERGRRGRPSRESRDDEVQHNSSRTQSTVRVRVHEQREERRQDSPPHKRSPSPIYRYVQASRRGSSQQPQTSKPRNFSEEVPQTRGPPLSDYYRHVQRSRPQSRQSSRSWQRSPSPHSQDFGQDTQQTCQRSPSLMYRHVPAPRSQPKQRSQSSHAQDFRHRYRETRERSGSSAYGRGPEGYDGELPMPIKTSTKKPSVQLFDKGYLKELNDAIPLPPTPVQQSPQRPLRHWASRESNYSNGGNAYAGRSQPGGQHWGSANDLEDMLAQPSQPATKQKGSRHFISQENVMDNLEKLFATSDDLFPEQRTRERAGWENNYDSDGFNFSGSSRPIRQPHMSNWENHSDDWKNGSTRPSQPLREPNIRQRESAQNSYERINDISTSTHEASGRRRRERRSPPVPQPRRRRRHDLHPDNHNQKAVVTETYVDKRARQTEEERRLRKITGTQSPGSKESLGQFSERREAVRYYQNDWEGTGSPVATAREPASRKGYRRNAPTDPSLADAESVYGMERCNLPRAPTPPSESAYSQGPSPVWDWNGLDEEPYLRSSASEMTVRHDRAYAENRQHQSLPRHVPRLTNGTSRQSSFVEGQQREENRRREHERMPSATDFRGDNHWTYRNSRDGSAGPGTPNKHVTFKESEASRNAYNQSETPVFPDFDWGDDTGFDIPPPRDQNQGDWRQNSGADNGGSSNGDSSWEQGDSTWWFR